MRRVALVVALIAVTGLSQVISAAAVGGPRARMAVHCQRIFWRTMRDGAQVCPGYHDLLADRAFWYLKWSSWRSGGARGHGKYACTDSACRGQIIARVTIKLTRARRCPDGARIFTRFDASFSPNSEGARHWHWSIPCNGMTGGGGG